MHSGRVAVGIIVTKAKRRRRPSHGLTAAVGVRHGLNAAAGAAGAAVALAAAATGTGRRPDARVAILYRERTGSK